jgi:hypothetical protein
MDGAALSALARNARRIAVKVSRRVEKFTLRISSPIGGFPLRPPSCLPRVAHGACARDARALPNCGMHLADAVEDGNTLLKA